MTKKISITPTQLMLLYVGSSLMFPYTFLPVINSGPANQDSWFVAIYATVYIVLLSSPLLFLTNKFKGLSAYQITEDIMGKVLAKIICILFSLFFLFCYCACMIMLLIFLHAYMYPFTPIWAVCLFIIIPITYAAYKGPGVLGRFAVFITPYMLFTIILFFFLGMDMIDLTILKPSFVNSDFWKINAGAFLTGARTTEIFIFFIFSMYIEKDSRINKIYFKSVFTYLIVFLILLFSTILVLGIDVAKHSWNPYFAYVRLITVYDFIQRIEAINTIAWLLGGILKLSVYGYMSSHLLSEVFNMKSKNKLIIPISILAFFICINPLLTNTTLIQYLRADDVFPFITLPVVFVIPFIMLIVYLIKKRYLNYKQKKDLLK